MCGIVGYIGNRNAQDEVLKGLSKLEYRGYDSSGIATVGDKQLSLFKEKGKIDKMASTLVKNSNGLGIGHSRWATNGKANKENAHPHLSASGRFALVHNGIIENAETLKNEKLRGVKLKSETDTEVIVQLIERNIETSSSVEEAFVTTLRVLKGSFAIAMVDKFDENKIYVSKQKSPLLIGIGEGETMVASDAMAFIHLTNKIKEIKDGEYAVLSKEQHKIIQINDNQVITRDLFEASIKEEDLEKGLYPHFMLKEIDEQPAIIRKLLTEYLPENKFTLDNKLIEKLNEANKIWIIACGTSYHAGLIGKRYLENNTDKEVEVYVASEFAVDPPEVRTKTFAIYISQSGETADSREALLKTKNMGVQSLTITNVEGSTLSRESDFTLLLHAGPEIAVASTKAYTAQLTLLLLLSYALGGPRYDLSKIKLDIAAAAAKMEQIILEKENIKEITYEAFQEARNAFFIGRSTDYDLTLEGALKLKEISYIQAEGFAGGELKHGTIALIEEGTPVIAIDTLKKTSALIRSNIEEVRARGANVIVLSRKGTDNPDDQFVLDELPEGLYPLLSVVVLQLVSYYAALQRGNDIDRPRNLAKSCTVF